MNNKTVLTIIVYFGGLLTGLALIVYPAMGNIFTDASQFGFSSAQFGRIFIPQMVLAILASLFAPLLVLKSGTKKILISGILALLLSTLLLFVSHFFIHSKTESLMLVFTGTSFLGLGFGMVITVLNPLAFRLFPKNELASVTGLHFALGLGTAGAPLLLGLFQTKNTWWYFPLLISIMLLVLFFLTVFLKLENVKTEVKTLKIPKRLWGFVCLVTLYGMAEGAFGSYGTIFLKSQGLTMQQASLGLGVFWGSLAFGRICYSLMSIKFKIQWFYVIAPFIVACLLFMVPLYTGAQINIGFMALAGIFMASIFPTSVNWATKEFSKNATMVSGLMVASLQLGTGISTNFLGYVSNYFPLALLFKSIGIIALILFFGIVYMRQNKPVSIKT